MRFIGRWKMTTVRSGCTLPCGLVRIARSRDGCVGWHGGQRPIADPATVFDSSDGVRSQSTTAGYSPHVAKSADGKLWFLPSDGVGVVDPRHLPFNKLPPPVHIEQITADRKTYDATSNPNLRLPPLVRDLEIDYTALSLVAPEKIRFRVQAGRPRSRLEGRRQPPAGVL